MKPFSRSSLIALTTAIALALCHLTCNVVADQIAEPHIMENQEHLDIHFNKNVANLMDVIDASDKLVLLYIFHSQITHDQNGQDWTMLDKMFMKVLEELKSGYVTTYAIDCSAEHPEIDPKIALAKICEKRDDFQPIFQLYKPAEIKINPYTGKEMPVQQISFASNQVSDPDVKRWITDNIPDYTQRLSTKEDADQFAEEIGIQKVYLFSAKQKVPPIYKALATHFRNRIRFAFVNIEGSSSEDLAKDFEVEKWPTLLIQNQFATPDSDGDKHHVFDGKMKLPEMIEFVAPFALAEDQKKEERVIQSKSQTTVNQQNDESGYMLLTSVHDVEDKILQDHWGSLLYIAQKEQLTYLPIVEEFARSYGDFLRIAVLIVDDVAEMSADLKREFKSAKLPQFRFYPNEKTGQDKRQSSFEIMFNKSDDIEEIKERLLNEIKENLITDVKDVSEKVYYSLGASNAKDGKISVLYMYENEEVSFTYKALSVDPHLKDDFVFFALDGPSESMTNGQPLPGVQGMMNIDEENPTPRIFNFQGMQQVNYPEFIKALLQMFPEKWEKFQQELLAKEYKKQNPTGDINETKSIPREFKEIRSQKDYDEICKSHKACAIAILPAITSIDYELESFKEKQTILEEVDALAGKNLSPLHYTWINATCHAEVFQYFDVDPTALPTVVYLHTQHNKHGSMIGKFDKESILEHEEKFKSGKLPIQDIKVDPREFIISDVDCQKEVLQEVDDDDDFKEILAEILAEEQAKRDAEDAESNAGKKKAGNKKGGKKGGKKGKKGGKKGDNFKSDEL